MHTLWHLIGPLLDAAQARNVLEIGTGDGALTRLLLARAAQCGGIIHSVDVEAAAEVCLLQEQAGPSFVFHHGSSIDVIPHITDIDAVLIDGDHNWYTVLGELRAIAALAQVFPLVLLHDVAWPYGRRDMYYSPSSIPPSFRHPYGRKGLQPGQGDAAPDGGFNSGLYNALYEGGPRNGVRTAIEDWLAETTDPPHFIIVPGLHGLGILAPTPLLQHAPVLAALLDGFVPAEPIVTHIHTLELDRLHVKIRARDTERTSENERLRLAKSLEESENERLRLAKSLEENMESLQSVLRTRSWRWTAPFRIGEAWLRQKLRHSRKEDQHIAREQAQKEQNMPLPVDIIIPVFNAVRSVIRCIESVLTCTSGTPFRLIIIDDASTETPLHAYYRQLAERGDLRICILWNVRNLGFVRTANRGMSLSETRDVVLLNSDTEVTPGWLEGLRAVAYGKPEAASVTPLSNCASCFSVLAEKDSAGAFTAMGAARIGILVREHALHLTPKIPTAVGFCMYIRRTAIKAVGTFDEDFGIGYGEENDWCMRASAAGFRHYLDDATFVYHKGHVSMHLAGHIRQGDEHPAESQTMLEHKHPSYSALISEFRAADTTLPRIRAHLRDALLHSAGNRQLRIAFLLHSPIDGRSVGGTEFHVRDLTDGLAAQTERTVIFPQQDALIAEHHTASSCTRYAFPLLTGRQRGLSLARAFATILRAFGVELLHVHHVLGASFHLLRVAKRQGLAVVYTIHDFHALGCVHPLLIGSGPDHCVPASWERIPGTKRTYAAWRHGVARALQSADCFVFPSHSTKQLFDMYYSSVGGARRIIGHGTDFPRHRCAAPNARRRICFLGLIHTRHKGGGFSAAVALELAHRGMDICIIGAEQSWCPTKLALHPRIRFIGSYDRNDLPRIFEEQEIGLACLLSLYHETFSFTLSEVWCAGIPAYVTPVGALAERVAATGAGRIAPCMDPYLVADDILAFLRTPAYEQARIAAQTLPLKTNAEMCAEYLDLYRNLLSEKPVSGEFHSPNTLSDRTIPAAHFRHEARVLQISAWLSSTASLPCTSAGTRHPPPPAPHRGGTHPHPHAPLPRTPVAPEDLSSSILVANAHENEVQQNQ